jgi:hypothetical protein
MMVMIMIMITMAFFFLSSAIVVWFVDHVDHANYVIENNESNQAVWEAYSCQ